MMISMRRAFTLSTGREDEQVCPLVDELSGTRAYEKVLGCALGSEEKLFCYNVRLGVQSFVVVSNEDGHIADAAAKVMIPSVAPDPLLNAALPQALRSTAYFS